MHVREQTILFELIMPFYAQSHQLLRNPEKCGRMQCWFKKLNLFKSFLKSSISSWGDKHAKCKCLHFSVSLHRYKCSKVLFLFCLHSHNMVLTELKNVSGAGRPGQRGAGIMSMLLSGSPVLKGMRWGQADCWVS